MNSTIRIALIIIGAILIIIIVTKLIYRRFHPKVTGRKKRKYYKAAHVKIKSDNKKEVLDAHNEDKEDPLVLIYNTPELMDEDPRLREEVRQRMLNTLEGMNGPEEIETIERILDANETFAIDPTIVPVAIQTVRRVAAGADLGTLMRNNVQDDPQNVHDPTVIKQLRNELNELETSMKAFGANPEPHTEVMNGIMKSVTALRNSGEVSAERAEDALKVARAMLSSTGTCMSYDNKKESDILRNVWTDVKDSPDKVHNLILGLADGATSSGTVCMNGRIARIIGANSAAVSQTDIKSAVYSYAGKIMNEGGNYSAVERYIDEVTELPETQKIILKEECRSVFDDIGGADNGAAVNNDTPATDTATIAPVATNESIQTNTPIISAPSDGN